MIPLGNALKSMWSSLILYFDFAIKYTMWLVD